jgi:succinylarginine dihydrolase
LEVFVWGRRALDPASLAPSKFPARQTLESVHAIARRHQLDTSKICFPQQNPQAIDAGAFHNDVIAVGNQNVLLCHEMAFVDQTATLNQLRQDYNRIASAPLLLVQFSSREISLEQAVQSYLFNSQLVTRPDGGMTLVSPAECQEAPAAKNCIDRLLNEETPVDRVEFFDLRQSMNNGGGPACLRLRIVLTDAQQSAIHQGVVLTDALYGQLVQWVNRHYRDELKPDDLRDPKLMIETQAAYSQLLKLLDLNR